MSNPRLLNFKSFLTEHFTAFAVEVFSEVESIVEACHEENKRLRSMLHMVLSPEIKLPRIDISQYNEATNNVREPPVEPNTRLDAEISEPLIKKPKEEQSECHTSWDTKQQLWPEEMDNSNVPDCAKNKPEEDQANMSCITDPFNIQVVDYNQDSSATVAAYEIQTGQGDSSSLMLDEAGSSSSFLQNEEVMDNSQKHKKNPKTYSSTRRAEIKVAITMVQHNISLVFSDHLSPLFKECFPDSKIANKYSLAQTKTTAIINKCIAPHLMNELARNLAKQPFSLTSYGSNSSDFGL